MKIPNCYASLENYVSLGSNGEAQKIYFDPTSPQIFAKMVRKTPALILELCLKKYIQAVSDSYKTNT